MNIKYLILAVLSFYCFDTFTQINLPSESYFASPVNYEYRLSGNFCELRENHFHAGIDIKPSNIAGNDNIFSIGDGFISRIKVSASGYGKVIYIDHPDVGYTSVYAHLNHFNDIIEYTVKQYQIAQESFEIDFYPEPHVFPIIKKDYIGDMGNTGFSFGKHLHFEIRDTKTEKPINPFLFGMNVNDGISPTLVSLSIHGLDNDFKKIYEKRISHIKSIDEVIELAEPIIVPSSKIGLALKVFDRTDKSHNKQGIYKLHMYLDDSLVFSYHLDKISFDQTKNINGFYDYLVKKNERQTYSLCYKLPGNDLEFLADSGNGLIELLPNRSHEIKLVVEDFKKNKKIVQFTLIHEKIDPIQISSNTYQFIIKVGEEKIINYEDLTMNFEKKSLFRNIQFDIESKPNGKFEKKYKIFDSSEPIKSPIKIQIKSNKHLSSMANKAVIVKINANGSKINYGGKWEEEKLTSKITEFGTYAIDYDTVPPTIKVVNFNRHVGKRKYFEFDVRDNFTAKGDEVERISYKVWIDDVFVISPYSAKSSHLKVPLGFLNKGIHSLKIKTWDHSDNFSVFSSEFIIP